MSSQIPRRHTLGFKFGGITLALFFVALSFLGGNLYMQSSIQGDHVLINVFARGRYYSYEMLYLINRLFDEQRADRTRIRTKLDEIIAAMDQRFEDLTRGNLAIGLSRSDDPEIRAGIAEGRQMWEAIKPSLVKLADKALR